MKNRQEACEQAALQSESWKQRDDKKRPSCARSVSSHCTSAAPASPREPWGHLTSWSWALTQAGWDPAGWRNPTRSLSPGWACHLIWKSVRSLKTALWRSLTQPQVSCPMLSCPHFKKFPLRSLILFSATESHPLFLLTKGSPLSNILYKPQI